MPAIERLTIGLENELAIPRDCRDILPPGPYHSDLYQIVGAPVKPDGSYWKVNDDSSITAPSGFYAGEIISPVLGPTDLPMVTWMIDWMAELGCRINSSMGQHVHIGFQDDSEDVVLAFQQAYIYFEKMFYGLNGKYAPSRFSGAGSHYCNPSNGHSMIYGGHSAGLNVSNWYRFGSSKRTVEVRVWRASKDAEITITRIGAVAALAQAVKNGRRFSMPRIEDPMVAAAKFNALVLDDPAHILPDLDRPFLTRNITRLVRKAKEAGL